MCTVEVVLLLSSVVKITEAVTFLSFCDNLAVNWLIVLDPFSLTYYLFWGEKFCCAQSAKEHGLTDG